MPVRVLIALLLPLAVGCGPTSDPPRGESDAPGEAARVDTAMVRTVSPEQTLGLLAGGVAAASPSLAIQTIDRWIARIDSAEVEGAGEAEALGTLSEDLTRLRNLLQSSPLDGPAIGRALRDVGATTADLAPPATPLGRLAETLRREGLRLAPDTTAASGAEGGIEEDS